MLNVISHDIWVQSSKTSLIEKIAYLKQIILCLLSNFIITAQADCDALYLTVSFQSLNSSILLKSFLKMSDTCMCTRALFVEPFPIFKRQLQLNYS